MDYGFLERNKIIPVAVFKRLDEVRTALSALRAGGITAVEITFRTQCAKDAIALAIKEFPDMEIGAGTVLNAKQCAAALGAGARFVVSPGFSDDISKLCEARKIPYLPGVATATEIMMAKTSGHRILKFFPAGAMGGVKTLKALAAAFPDLRFVPTGGVDENNLAEYLALDCVTAVGGSFMFKGGPEDIAKKSAEALKIAEACGK